MRIAGTRKTKTRILLIKTFEVAAGDLTYPPLGILYLASSLQNNDDFEILPVDQSLSRFSDQEIEQLLKDFSPNIVGISSSSCEATSLRKYARIARKLNRDVTVISGGPYPSAAPEILLKCRDIDFAVSGEGEITIQELVECILNGGDPASIKGISFIDNDEIVTTESRPLISNPDSIKFPAWDLIDFRTYWERQSWNGINKNRRYLPIITSRGCPFGCIYCHNIHGKKFRARSPSNVLEEMELLYDKYGVREFHIVDDVFNLDISRSIRLLDLIISSKMKISLAFPNGIRGDMFTDELLDRMVQAGVYKMTFAVETASPRLQKLIGKNLNLTKTRENIMKAYQRGIITNSFFMIGLPDETPNEISQSIAFALKTKLITARFFVTKPFHGTKLYEMVKNKHPLMHAPVHDQHFLSPDFSISSINQSDLIRIYWRAHLKMFTSPHKIFSILLRYPHKIQALKRIFHAIWFCIIKSYDTGNNQI